MSPAVTILLITLGGRTAETVGAAEDPHSPAIVRATREALGPSTHVEVQRLDALPSDQQAAALGSELHADAVVEVTWTIPDHLHATIRMARQGAGRWLEREIGFRTADDDPTERSRTVGFAIASMLPEYTNREEAGATAGNGVPGASVPVTKSVQPTKVAPARGAPRATADEQDTSAEEEGGTPSEPGDSSEVDARRARRLPPLHLVRAVSAMAVAAVGVGDNDGSAGAVLDYRNVLIGPLWLRFGGSARFGFDPPPGVTARFFSAAAGLTLRGVTFADGRSTFGLRLDVLMLLDQLERNAGGVVTTKDKVLPGADLLAEGALYFTRSTAFLAAAGGEVLFGETGVYINGQRVSTLRPVHPVVEIGLRFGF